MFDVGFQELIVIGLIALVVVGPQRLPAMARTAGLWLGRARRILGSVKAEIDREIKAEELKEILRKQAEASPLHTILEETSSHVTKPLNGLRADIARDLGATKGTGRIGPTETGGTPGAVGASPGTIQAVAPGAGRNPGDPRPPA
jgi:sec-independent protein translocase protein TatB